MPINAENTPSCGEVRLTAIIKLGVKFNARGNYLMLQVKEVLNAVNLVKLAPDV